MKDAITIRYFDKEKDYGDVCAWWRGHSWPEIPMDHLSEIGLIAECGGKKQAAVWLYLLTPVFAAMEFLVTNPEAGARECVRAIHETVEHAKALSHDLGFKTVWTSLKHEKLARLFGEHGFQATDSGVTHFIARIN